MDSGTTSQNFNDLAHTRPRLFTWPSLDDLVEGLQKPVFINLLDHQLFPCLLFYWIRYTVTIQWGQHNLPQFGVNWRESIITMVILEILLRYKQWLLGILPRIHSRLYKTLLTFSLDFVTAFVLPSFYTTLVLSYYASFFFSF